MWKAILYFLLINLGYFALVTIIYAVGYEYDRAYRIYPEAVRLSYDLSISGVYGQRWVRFFQSAVVIGLFTDLVIATLYYWKRPVKTAKLGITDTDVER